MTPFEKNKKVTIQQLADELKISVSTVSRALSDHPRISVETKKLVYDAAEKRGFFQKAVQKSIVQKLHNAIVVFIPGESGYLIQQLVEGIRSVCVENKIHLIIVESYPFFCGKEALHYCYSLPVTGAILYIDGIESDDLVEVNMHNLPTVLTGDVDVLYPYPKIVIDHFMDAYLAVKHLSEIGSKRIVFLAGNGSRFATAQRIAGFKNAVNDLSLDTDSPVLQSDLSWTDIEACVQRIIHSNILPDAYLVEDGGAALLVMRCLAANGIQVPAKAKIVSLEENDTLSLSLPSITSVFSPSFDVGKSAALSLLKTLQEKDNQSKNSLIVKSPRLIVRNSSIL